MTISTTSSTSSATGSSTTSFEYVDPTRVVIGENMRLDPRLDKAFVASIKERGVLEPVLLYRDGDGALIVLAGQRRILAARQAGRPTVPATVADEPALADRLVDQYVENEHRAALTTSERIHAVEQMTLAGLSVGQIARRTATPKTAVEAAKTAATSTAREYADQLTLDQAAALAEFDDDPEAVEMLLGAARSGQFEHRAQRLRNDRAETARRAAFAETVTARGITVVERPTHSSGTVALHRLADADNNPLTADTHAACPGHAAYIDTAWRQPSELTLDDFRVDDTRVDDDQENEVEEGDPGDEGEGDAEDDEEGDGWQRPVEVLTVAYVCTDWRAHGHTDRWANSDSSEKKRAEEMTEDEREAAKAARRHVIESNKAWKAATEVRRTWLTTVFAPRKTAPAGAEAYLAQVVTEGWGHERATSDALTLAGFPAPDGDTWTAAAQQRQAVVDALATATPKRALQIGLAVAVAMWETNTNPDSWRSVQTQTVATLARLQDWGYPVSDIEQRILDDAATRTTTD